MKLSVYNLKGVIYEGEILSLNAKTASGEITVLDHHLPLISILKRGEIRLIDQANQTKIIMLAGGFLEVTSGNIVNILESV